MSAARPRGPIVIDTDVFSADLIRGSELAKRYAPIIAGRPAFISFQTVSNDSIFEAVPGLTLESARSG